MYFSPEARWRRKNKMAAAGNSDASNCVLRHIRKVRMPKVTHSVPATSANLGPGFDCLGVAVDLRARVSVWKATPSSNHPMADEASRAFFEASRVAPFAFDWSISNDIPVSRGLGSSVVMRLGLLHGLNKIAGSPLDADALYRTCARLEGHPDNAAPAAFGGFVAALPTGDYFRCDVSPELNFVFLIPEEQITTEASRIALPGQIPLADAAKSTAHAALITAAFASKQYSLLRGAMRDWMHEPFREAANPHLRTAVAAGVAAGALDGYLSGSGSAVACITLVNPETVAEAMRGVLPNARTLVLRADNAGIAAAD